MKFKLNFKKYIEKSYLKIKMQIYLNIRFTIPVVICTKKLSVAYLLLEELNIYIERNITLILAFNSTKSKHKHYI